MINQRPLQPPRPTPLMGTENLILGGPALAADTYSYLDGPS